MTRPKNFDAPQKFLGFFWGAPKIFGVFFGAPQKFLGFFWGAPKIFGARQNFWGVSWGASKIFVGKLQHVKSR